MINSILNYRYYIFNSIRQDLTNRFVRSKLGGLWVIINPLVQVLIYALILSNVLSSKLPGTGSKYSYSIYLMSGLLVWTLFTEVLTRYLNIFIANGNLLKKVKFPFATLPIIASGSAFLSSYIFLLIVLVIFFIIGHGLSFNIFYLLPLSLLLVWFTSSIGLVLGVVNVFIRDLGQLIPLVLQIWFWFTPIVYPISIIPAQYQKFLYFNPIFFFAKAYQDILLYSKPPAPLPFVVLSIITAVIFVLSVCFYKKARKEITDTL